MDVEKYLYKCRVLYGVYGVLSNKFLDRRRTKIVFCGMENACFNATCFLDSATDISPQKVAVLTSYLAAEMKTYITKVLIQWDEDNLDVDHEEKGEENIIDDVAKHWMLRIRGHRPIKGTCRISLCIVCTSVHLGTTGVNYLPELLLDIWIPLLHMAIVLLLILNTRTSLHPSPQHLTTSIKKTWNKYIYMWDWGTLGIFNLLSLINHTISHSCILLKGNFPSLLKLRYEYHWARNALNL